MIRKNYYKRITESIVKAYHDNNLDSAMGSQEENMGKKIVAIITADPDQDLEWEHEYQPFGRTSLTQDDEDEAYAYEFGDDECEGEDCEHEDECEGDECDEPVIGSGFEDEDGLEGIKDVLMDIRDELSHLHASDEDLEGAWEADDENPMFDSSDDFEDEDEDDGESALEPTDDWADDEESEDEDEDEDEDDAVEEDEEFDFLGPAFRDDAPKSTPAKPTKRSSMREEDILGPAFRDDAPKFTPAKPTKKSSSRVEDFLGPAFRDDAPTKSVWEQEEETIDDDDEIAIYDSLDN